MFKVWLWLAKKGWFYHKGDQDAVPFWMPKAKVKFAAYKGAEPVFTVPMPIGNAIQWAELYNGEVLPV